jgi:hypothetical protein
VLTCVTCQVPFIVHATTTTTQTDTATVTTTNTATETSTIVEQTTVYTATLPVIAIPTFTVYAIGGDNNGNPIADIGDGTGRVGNAKSLRGPVLQFTTVNNNQLQVLNGPNAGSTGATNPNASGIGAYLLFGSAASGFPATSCQVTYNADGTCPLSCSASRGTTSYDCGVYWRIGGQSDVGSCSQFTPYAVGG